MLLPCSKTDARSRRHDRHAGLSHSGSAQPHEDQDSNEQARNWLDPSPVDFSSLDNEYIGILYEGLLDFELRQATATNPIIFLAVGNQPALPLATLEAMDDKGLKNLLEKMKDTSSGSDEGGEESEGEGEDEATGDSEEQPTAEASEDAAAADAPDDDDAETVESDDTAAEGDGDDRHTIRSRAEAWARRAIAAGGMVTKPRGKMTEEKKLQYQAALDTKARQIITKVVLPGEWYLVRWGGTRKGSGTYYTRPQFASPRLIGLCDHWPMIRRLVPTANPMSMHPSISGFPSDQSTF